jgi:hypothetical protein
MNLIHFSCVFGLMSFMGASHESRANIENGLKLTGSIQTLCNHPSLFSSLQSTLNIVSSNTTLLCYFGGEFKELMEQRRIDQTELIRSFQTGGEKRISSGKSGSFFITTNDNSFVLKSISESEFETFNSISSDYFKYLRNNQKSLLVPIFGLFKIGYFSPIYLIIMPNLKQNSTETTQYFDIKGRDKKQKRNRASSVIDDDNLPSTYPFAIHHGLKMRLFKDIAFLRQKRIMDYSLFAVQTDQRTTRINIIDYLTRFSWRKQIANVCKCTVWKEQQIASVNPDKYAERMGRFIDHVHKPWSDSSECCLKEERPDLFIEMNELID